MSQAFKHGVLNVSGHVRLQDALCVEQLATHASEEASANLNLLALITPLSANAVPCSAQRTVVAKMNFMKGSVTAW